MLENRLGCRASLVLAALLIITAQPLTTRSAGITVSQPQSNNAAQQRMDTAGADYHACTFQSFTAAVNAMPGTNVSLGLTCPMVASSQTISSNITLVSTGNGTITVPDGVTLTINGPVQFPIKQVFILQGTGKVVFGTGKVSEVFAEWWGADGTGAADAAPAINAMILAVPSLSNIKQRLLGKYLINSTINIINNAPATGAPFQYGLWIEGNGWGGQANWSGGVLIWNGNSTSPLFNVKSRDNTFKNLYITVASGKTLMSAFEMDRASGSITNKPVAPACTGNRWKDVIVYGNNPGALTDGFVIGRSGNPSNNEFFDFDNVSVFYATNAGVNVLQSDYQSKKHKFKGGQFYGCKYGFYFLTGDFVAVGTDFSSNTGAALALGVGDTIQCISCTGEGNNRLLITSSGSTPNASSPITFQSCRFATDRMNADGRWIIYSLGGPVNLIGNVMGTGRYNANFKVSVSTFAPGSTVNSWGNTWPNQNPFDPNATYYTVNTSGDRCMDRVGNVSNCPYAAPVAQGVRWTEVKGVSSYNATASDTMLLVDATQHNVTIHLPANPSLGTIGAPGKQYIIKKYDTTAHTVTIDSPSTNGVDGRGSYTIPGSSRGSVIIQWAGGAQLSGFWWVISKF